MLTSHKAEAEILKIKKIANAKFPIALCFYDKETILFTEKEGAVMVIKATRLQKEALKRFNVTTGFKRGLLGIA